MPQSPSEEIANTVTHGLGLVLSTVGAAVLLVACYRQGSVRAVATCGVYSASLIAVYAASTLWHALRSGGPKQFFAILDRAVIYLLIAGTYTPLAMQYMPGGWWWLLTAAMWGIALPGCLCQLLLPGRAEFTSITVYVLLGWLPAVAIKPLLAVVPVAALWWMIAGGLCYTAGAVFLVRDEKVHYFHAVWHVFVIAGSACHYTAILLFVGLRTH